MTTPTATAALPPPDLELRVLSRLTRALPPVKGVGALANVAKRVYTRRDRSLVEVEAHGLRLRLDPHEWLEREIIFTPQLYDRELLRFLRANLGRGDNFVDAGANVGIFGLVASRVAPEGRVLSIDADRAMFERLQEHIRINGARNVTAVNVGLAEEEGEMPFVSGPRGYRGVGNFYAAGMGQQGVPTRVRPLLPLLDEHGFERIGGMKVDIEGFEYRALQPFFRDAPRARWPGFVLLEEFSPTPPHAKGSALALMRSLGYEVVWSHGADHILQR